MDLFKSLVKGSNAAATPNTAPQELPIVPLQPAVISIRTASRRDTVYAVRVRDDFKSDILSLQAQIQLERREQLGKCRKVTEGEVVELMLEAFKASRGNGEASSPAVPLSKDVLEGIHMIARFRRIAASQVVEELVVREIGHLGLIPMARR